ncbi:MAG TPA: ABC transporter substrate-binding protein, partial [Acidimicrobiia bacterium]|nr:ABC transporter substrate-binding protein [Acidimicrobiia bacterium]
MNRGGTRGLTVLAVLAFAAGGACGTTSKPSGDGSTGAGSNSPAVAGADVKQGGVWRESFTEPATLDPSFIFDGSGVKAGKLLFVGLTTFDDNPELAMRPGVAERWSANADCTQWTFNLRRSAFSNGEPVTAESFIRTMTRAADGRAASRVAGHLSEIQGYAALHGTAGSPPSNTTFSGLSAPDPQTLVIRLNAPNCEFDRKTYHWVYSPVPSAAGAYDNKAFSDAPIGNGPFMLKQGTKWEHDKGIVLVRNDSYFGPKPHLDEINFTIFGSQAPPGTTWQSFQAGELDVGFPPAGQRRQAEGTYGPQGGFVNRLSYSTGYVQPNNSRGPMANVDARKAVSMVLDRDAISQALQEGYAAPATAFVAPRWGPYHQPGVCDACRLDPAAAKEAAARGGLTVGTRLRFVVTPALVPTAQAMKDQLEKNLGIDVDVEGLPAAEVTARRTRGDFDLGIGAYVPDYPTVDALLYAVLGKDSAEN